MENPLLIELSLRFFSGGIVVSAFALLSDVFDPKSFAGLFAAAPSVALATLGLAISNEGAAYASLEARSMMVGAIALLAYSQFTAWWLMRSKGSSLSVALFALIVWFGVAFGLWSVVLR
jgi:hypothetical protein